MEMFCSDEQGGAMKLQRYVTNDGVMPPGEWVKASDAKTLEQENYKLKEELRYEKDARASDHFAYLDMQKYAYRVGHKDECFTREKRIDKLEEALRQIRCKAVLSCDIGLQDFCDRALETKG
jgi:hypothetical protein